MREHRGRVNRPALTPQCFPHTSVRDMARSLAKPARPRADASTVEELIEAAARIREHAYAPYSRFKVGAAVLAGSGRVFTGCNVENASYGLALCAERGAVAAAVAAGESEILSAAVVTASDEPSPPCGMCLQTLAEFGAPETPIILVNLRGVRRRLSLRELMPHAFDRSYL